MEANARDRAQEVLETALAERGGPDPREPCRERLRELRELDRSAYDEALRHFGETLAPGIASGSLDPIDAWTDFARTLAERCAPGRTVAIDATGRATPWDPVAGRGSLVLHLPGAGGGRALLVSLPAEPSDAQRATFDWLVLGRQKLETAG